jgi:hypothetical protein
MDDVIEEEGEGDGLDNIQVGEGVLRAEHLDQLPDDTDDVKTKVADLISAQTDNLKVVEARRSSYVPPVAE